MALPRRAAPAAPAAPAGINFGSLSAYSGGFTLPEGDYALEFTGGMEQLGEKAQGRAARLGVFITAHSLTDPKAEPHQQFLSMGRKAHESFVFDAETGKRLVPVPGGAGGNPNNATNWYLFLKSLYDCGLPEGIFTDSFEAIDGIWVHTQNIPEPEERKGFGASTGEVQQERRSSLVPVVTEIKDDGKPWEGGGGFDFQTAAAPAAAPKRGTPARVAAPAARPAARPAPAPVAPAAEAGDEELETAALNGATKVLESAPNGVTRLKMRTDTFKAVKAAQGDETAQSVMETFFANDEALNGLLGPLGYKVSGANVVPA